VDVMRRLYERLGLCAEYRRAQMVTTDVEAVNAYYKDLVTYVTHQEYEKALACVDELKVKVDMQLPYNRQEIERVENYVLYNSKRINSDEFAEQTIAILGYTIDVSKLEKCLRLGVLDAYYFTRAELSCLHDLAFVVKSDVTQTCLEIIEQICSNAMREEYKSGKTVVYEFLMERMASKLGDERKFKESNDMSCIILKECLKHYRLDKLPSLIYNYVWNYEQDCDNAVYNSLYVNHKLSLCENLSRFNRNYNDAAFFQMKKDRMI